ncbi:immunoglobulin-like domain-containing protein [Peloplasma aerotolerans]|uniref:Thioredoxin domain-containing protein n=1 Tax=Peloplasma aerotolerans TaxID=3044389 RepID=A0AAW6UAA0_9MOLU|nr:immunoglobulin-like domain-containing protein [Mariniplasma sp. M4Ah]MDI6451933.1 hypothetical protein [Mariniplasma sp. M4Ah]MDR4968669.1 hypothetical protein [Acholeplasmataceae bacterium]
MKKNILFNLIITLFIVMSSCQTNDQGSELYQLTYGDSRNNVRNNISLVTETETHVVFWSSSDENVISVTGEVTRPLLGESNKKVTLTANYDDEVIKIVFTVIALTGDEVYDKNPWLNDKDHIIIEINYNQLLNLFDQEKSLLVYLGFEQCPYCREYLPTFNKIAKEYGFTEIFYFNFLSTRGVELDEDENPVLKAEFQEIIHRIDTSFLASHSTYSELNWLFAPTFMALNDGIVVDLFTGAVEGHNASRSTLTEEQQTELEEILTRIINKIT